MEQLPLVILLAIAAAGAGLLYLRGLKFQDRAVKAEQERASLDAELKKTRGRVRKLDKQVKKDGTQSSKEERKVSTLQKSIENLRQELAGARRNERKALGDLDRLSAEYRAFRSQQDERPVVVEEEEPVVEEPPIEVTPDPEKKLRVELADALDAVEKGARQLKKREDKIEALTTQLDELRAERNASKRELIIARRKAEHQRRAYVLTQGQLEVAQDLLSVLEQRTGTKSEESFLLESLRAQKRLSIKKGRVEEQSNAQMPVVGDRQAEPASAGGEP